MFKYKTTKYSVSKFYSEVWQLTSLSKPRYVIINQPTLHNNLGNLVIKHIHFNIFKYCSLRVSVGRERIYYPTHCNEVCKYLIKGFGKIEWNGAINIKEVSVKYRPTWVAGRQNNPVRHSFVYRERDRFTSPSQLISPFPSLRGS